MRQRITFKIKSIEAAKRQLLNFTEHFDVCNFYDSNEIKSPLQYGRFEFLVGFGCIQKIEGTFDKICSIIHESNHWVMGYLGYTAHTKFNINHPLNPEEVGFYFPKLIVYLTYDSNFMVFENNGISNDEFQKLLTVFSETDDSDEKRHEEILNFEPCTIKSDYLENVEKIKQNILEGDYYEINYCQKFFHNGVLKNPLTTFHAINKKSPTPFAAFIKSDNFNILCTSPERFIFKDTNEIISQPIKGTNKRIQGFDNELQLIKLKNNTKEIAENIMIVDLVRNDLARISKSGSVVVRELCGTYPFALVNQMISTISGELQNNLTIADILRALFPMGSMTGAPKLEVMKSINHYENVDRGIYSGCIGYIMPNHDFDFNVVIRTLVEDKIGNNVSFHVGSAITYDSDAEKEYEECLLKAKGLFTF